MSDTVTEKFIVKTSLGAGHLTPDQISRLQKIVDAATGNGKKIGTAKDLIFFLLESVENPVNRGDNAEANEKIQQLTADNVLLNEKITDLTAQIEVSPNVDVTTLKQDNDNLRAELEAEKEKHDQYVKNIEGDDEKFNEVALSLKKDHPGTQYFMNFAAYHMDSKIIYVDKSVATSHEDVLLQIMTYIKNSRIERKFLPPKW